MKKCISLSVMLLFAATMFAQKANVKKAYRESEAMENPDFYKAIELIEPALTEPTTKDDPYTWWVAGHIYDMQIKNEGDKVLNLTGTLDEEVVRKSAYTAFDYFVKAAELEKIPDAKGKVSDKYTKKLSETLAWYYKQQFILGYGAYLAEYEDYKGAIDAFDKHLAIVDLPFMQNYKGSAEFPKPEKDSNYYKLKFFAAYYTKIDGDTLNAIRRFEEIKDRGFDENTIYQNLYDLYEKRGDDANQVRILDAGIRKFPKEPFYVGTMINRLTDATKPKYDEALQYLDKAIVNSPNTAEYYKVKGFVLWKMGRQDDAITNYDKAIALEPTNPNYLVNKGEFLYEDGVALESAAMSVRGSQQDNLKQQSKQRFADAKRILTQALAMDSTNYSTLEYLRKIAIREDNMAEITRLQKLIDALGE